MAGGGCFSCFTDWLFADAAVQRKGSSRLLPPSVPTGWVAVWSSEAKQFYFANTVTKKTQWEVPSQPAITEQTKVRSDQKDFILLMQMFDDTIAKLPERNEDAFSAAMETFERVSSGNIDEEFKQLPAELQNNEYFAAKALERTSQFGVDKLYNLFPVEVQKKAEIIGKAFEKCYENEVPELYAALPSDVQKREAIARLAVEKCFPGGDMEDDDDSYYVERCRLPDLFKVLPVEVQTEDIVNTALDKCHEHDIASLFKALRQDIQKKAYVIDRALGKCASEVVKDLYVALPDQFQKSEAIARLAIEKCYPEGEDTFDSYGATFLHDLFKVLPVEVLTEAIVELALEVCTGAHVPSMFEAIPKEFQSNEKIIQLAFKRCIDVQIFDLFMALPAEVQKREDLIRKVVKSFPKNSLHSILSLYKKLPAEVQIRKDVVRAALHTGREVEYEGLREAFAAAASLSV